MPNNDLISRASVLEALRELEKKMRIGWEYDSFCSGVVRATQLVECFQQAPPVTDSLSEELESFVNEYENEIVLRYHSNDKEWVARYYPSRMEIPTINSPTNGFGVTPLAAVMKLKEALNSKP